MKKNPKTVTNRWKNQKNQPKCRFYKKKLKKENITEQKILRPI